MANRPPRKLDIPDIGPPPSHFGAKPRALWEEVVSLIPAGIAARADRFIVELTVTLLHRMRIEPHKVTPAMASQLRLCFAALGLSPEARIRIAPEPELPVESLDAEIFFPKSRKE